MKNRLIELSRTLIAIMRFAVLTIGVVGVSNAQYSVGFSEIYGGSADDEGCAIDIAEDGFVAVAGRSFSEDGFVHENKGGSDYWVMYLNSSGDTLWSRTYGGAHNDDIHAIAHNTSGGLAAFGTTWSDDGDVGNNPGVVGAWLLTLDAAGNPLVSRVYAGNLGEQGVDIAPLSDGGYALLVQSTSPELEGAQNNGNFDIWLARVNPLGATIWAKFYGGTEADLPGSVLRIQGGYMIAGATSSSDGDVTENKGGYDLWVLRLDADGEIVWQKTWGGSDDDLAHDIVMLEDGTFVVVGESRSEDGDRTSSYGGNDIWMLGIDGDGNMLWEKSYGGTEDDSGTGIQVVEGTGIVIMAQTESDNGTMTGNKGFEDTWVAFMSEQGSLIQEMNYGGGSDDLGGAMAVAESGEVFLCGTSASEDGNIPFGGPEPENLWLMQFEEAVDSCAPNNDCFIVDIGGAILNTASNGPIVCTEGCNVGAEPGPASSPGCQNFQGPAAWFKVLTDSAAEFITINVTSAEFNNPQIAVMQSINCFFTTEIACIYGSDGAAQLLNMPVDPNSAYFVVVGDAQGRTGTFNICALALDLNYCNINPQLYVAQTSMGSPLEGPYMPGETVQFCYEVNQWDKLECNGLQGIQPSFSGGWDTTSFNVFGMPVQVDSMIVPIANGTWDWWKLGEINYNFTNPSQGYQGGQGLPGGWYFTNLDDPPPNDGPDQTVGDITTCLPDESSWKVCFSLVAEIECTSNEELSVSMKTFGDGETGSVISQACQYDPPLTFSSFVNCCINPLIFPVGDITICSGDTVNVAFSSTIDPPVIYTYEAEIFGNIVGASSGIGPGFSQQLLNLGDDPAQVTYTIMATNAYCEASPMTFNVIVRPQPVANMTLLSPDTICAGDDVLIRFEFVGQQPYVAQYSANGVLQEEFLADEEIFFLTVQPEATTLYIFNGFNDAACPGNPNGAFTVVVRPTAEATLQTQLCSGDTLVIGNQEFIAGGNYTARIEDGASNGCDSIIHLEITGVEDQEVFIDASICIGESFVVGDSIYQESGLYTTLITTEAGCDSIVNLDLEVTDEIFEMLTDFACPGESVIFAGQVLSEGGVYYDTIPISGSCDSIRVLNLNIPDNISLILTVIEPDTTGKNTGGILIEISGGFPPYNYQWSTGDTTQDVIGLASDDYFLTVTDFVGCSEVFEFFVVSGTSELLEGTRRIEVQPNPVQSSGIASLIVVANGPGIRHLDLSILDLAGRIISRHPVQLSEGMNAFDLPMRETALPAGVFFVRLLDTFSGQSVVRKLVVVE